MKMSRREIFFASAAKTLPPPLSSRIDDARAATGSSLSDELSALSLADAFRAMRREIVTSRGLTLAGLQHIERQHSQINALISVTREEALAQASRLDVEAGEAKISSLHGSAVAVKDAIDSAGTRTMAASAESLYEMAARKHS
jgi:Asp-tRNA(Asn)/Glu-tRNA(Gln) amidotransferase A subunit family amidase